MSSQRRSKTQNVLFIIIDQLRADCLSGALADHVDLPNLRALMAEGVSFNRHYSVTNPCGPSRASILTGQYAMNHRSVRNGTPLRHDTPNIATEMRRAGYEPLLFGYTDTSQDPRMHAPQDPALTCYEHPMRGFREVLEMRLEKSIPWRAHLLSKGYRFDNDRDLFTAVSPNGHAPRLTDPALYRAEDSDTAFLTDAFLTQLPAMRGRGWFAHLTYIRPHPPLVAPAPYNSMYDPANLPLPTRLPRPEDEAALHPFIGPALANARASDMADTEMPAEASDDIVQSLRAVYLGLATEVDHHIGRILDQLRTSGELDHTLLIITADHGEMLGDHHSWGKHHLHDAAYHTPLILRAPDLPQPGRQVDLPTESIDIAPTILNWIGQPVPNSMDGRSLLPFLEGETPDDWRAHTFSELEFGTPDGTSPWQKQLDLPDGQSCLSILRDARFTLVEFAADLPPVLFDNERQGSLSNVASDPAYHSDLNRLTRALLRHRMRHMDHSLSHYMITPDGPVLHSRRR